MGLLTINIQKSATGVMSLVSDPSYTEDNFKNDIITMSEADLKNLEENLMCKIDEIRATALVKQADIFPENEIILETKLWNFVKLILVRLGRPTDVIERLIEVGMLKIAFHKTNEDVDRRFALGEPLPDVDDDALVDRFNAIKDKINELLLNMAEQPPKSRFN